MILWKPKEFKPEWPSPEDGCVFVLGGSLHGEILQTDERPFPPVFNFSAKYTIGEKQETLSVESIACRIERYRLEKFFCGAENQRIIWFYIHETEPTDYVLIHALTDLCHYTREAKSK